MQTPVPVHNASAHGTQVAGVAAGEFNNGYGSFGVAQDVEIVGIRVYDKTVLFHHAGRRPRREFRAPQPD